jgi:hypothetical protein
VIVAIKAMFDLMPKGGPLPLNGYPSSVDDSYGGAGLMLSNVAFGPVLLPSMVANRYLRTGRRVMCSRRVRANVPARFRGGASCKQHQNKCVSHMASYEGEAILAPVDGLYKPL